VVIEEDGPRRGPFTDERGEFGNGCRPQRTEAVLPAFSGDFIESRKGAVARERPFPLPAHQTGRADLTATAQCKAQGKTPAFALPEALAVVRRAI
jgi:hypothetical protein